MSQRRTRGLGPLPTYRTVTESAAAPQVGARTAVHETASVVEAPSKTNPGRMSIRLIKAGWSLNEVHYPADVLKRDGARAWPKGTKCFIDHATDTEEDAYPSGTIKNLAAVLTSDAAWNEQTQALEADVRLFTPWRDTLTDMAEHIGMSIRAWVYGDQGEAEGRSGFVVSSIAAGRSVDFVTTPAAGGAIMSVFESARQRAAAEARNVGAWLESRLHLALTQLGDDMYGDGRLTRDERIVLSSAIGDGLTAYTARVEADAPQLYQRDVWSYPEAAGSVEETVRRAAEMSADETRTALGNAVTATYGGDQVWTWIRDFDPNRLLVWFHISTSDESHLFEQSYIVGGDGSVELTGDRVEVAARTVYTPVDADETAPPTDPPATVTVAGDVTDGAPPTGSPNPPSEEEPAMSGTHTGPEPGTAGTATVAEPPIVNPPDPQPPVDPAPTQPELPAQEAATAVALRQVTEQLSAMREQLAAATARADARDAETRQARNEATARQAVTAAIDSPDVPAQWRSHIAPRVAAVVLAGIPVGESGDVDMARLGEAVTAAVAAELGHVRTIQAQALEEAGVGLPSGLGASAAPAVNDGLDAELAELFKGSLGMSEAAATVAVKGRG